MAWILLPNLVSKQVTSSSVFSDAVDPITVRLEPFPPEIPLRRIDKELVGMVVGTFFSSVHFDVMLNSADILDRTHRA